MQTKTGSYGIGFRRGWSEWNRDLDGLVKWASENGFACLDVGNDAPAAAPVVKGAGLALGSVDLPAWKELLSPDAEKRAAAVAKQTEYIEAVHAVAGPMNYFIVMMPEDPSRPRSENFGYMVESSRKLAEVLERTSSKLVMEGYPGPGALCCTPETLRAFFKETQSPALGINYDPSHLIRMGIDSLRFLDEFSSRVYHVHAKDTELFEDARYEFGSEQPPCFAKPHGFGSVCWRYTLPGKGIANWSGILERLSQAGYQGYVSIELEDENFNGTTEGEQRGLLQSAEYLASV